MRLFSCSLVQCPKDSAVPRLKILLFLEVTGPFYFVTDFTGSLKEIAMKIRPTEGADINHDESNDANDHVSNKANASTRLERRRRIEDLDEEKRLREELSEF